MILSHTRILIFGSIILLLVGGGVLGLFILFPKKNDSFQTVTKPSQIQPSSKVVSSSSDISVNDNIPDSTKDILTEPTTSNFVFTSITPIYYFASKIADGGIEIVDLSASSKDRKVSQLSKNDFALINKAKGIITTDNFANQWIKDFYIDQPKKLDLTSGINQNNSFWASFVLLRANLILIKNFLIQKDEQNKIIYQKNYDRLILKLDGMEEKYKKKLGNCSIKVVVENENKFVDLTSEFGFTHITIDTENLSNIDKTKEESIRKSLLTNKTKTLFLVGDYSDADLNIISTTLENIEIIALGDFGSTKNNVDYFDLLDKNLDMLGEGLGCVKI